MKYHSSQFFQEAGVFGNFLLSSYYQCTITYHCVPIYAYSVAVSFGKMSASHRFGPSKAILAHNRGTAPFPLSKKGVTRRNLVRDIWLTGGSTNGAEKEPQDWGALVADGRKELISLTHCFFFYVMFSM